MSANCPGFKPGTVKPTRCRRCFKDYSEHVIKDESSVGRKKSLSDIDSNNTQNSSNSVQQSETLKSSNLTVPSTSSDSSTGNDSTATVRIRTRTRELPKIDDNPQEEASVRRTRVRPSSESTPLASTSDTSSNSVRTRVRSRTSDLRLEPDGADDKNQSNNKPKRIAKIIGAEESLPIGGSGNHDNSPDVEFILRVKTATKEHEYDEDSIAATDTTETTLVGSVDTLTDEYQNKIAGLIKQLEKSEESMKSLEKQNNELQTKIKRMEKTQENRLKQISETDKQDIEKTASELVKLRAKCRELESNNAELRDEKNILKIEVKELNREVDAFKRENPKELKETITNLRLKLQQTEHLCEELTEENEEMKKDVKSLEIEFQELHDNFREDQSSEFRVLKRELETTSKNCRVLQFKLKKAERSTESLENEKIELQKKVKDLLETTKLDVDKHKMKELETELSIAKEVSLKLHAEIEQLREERVLMEQQLPEKNPSQKALNRLSAGRLSPSVSFESKDYEQVVRDLYDTMEREKDLQEQMKFAEEETRTMRKKLSTMEQENEILMMQIRKMANQKNKKGDIDEEESEELSPEEMKLNLELYEQEMVVLRRKTDELEQENENCQQEIKYLQEKLVSQPMTKIEIPEIPVGSPPNVIYEHKIRILESEARELRKKLVDREKEYESLRTEIEVHRRKASKVIIRSRSLDSEQQVDLKRQLQLVEQEASILRQKLMSIEAENDKLVNENKRFQLRLSRKPPPGPADQLQVENIELKERIKDLERRCENIKSDLMASKSQTNLSNFLISETETDLINTLKKQLKNKESEITTLNTRLTQSDVELNRITREFKKLKETISVKRRPTRVVRETATRMELKDIIKELEEDVNEFHNTVKAKDIIIENLTEELSEIRREFDQMKDEIKTKDVSNTSDLSNSNQMNDRLKKELENEKKKLKALQTKLDSITKEKGIDFNVLDNIEVLQAEKKELAIKLEDIQDELVRERNKCDDFSTKLTAITKQKEELIKNSEMCRKQKEIFEDENEVIKEKLRKCENSLKEMTNKFEVTFKELNDLKKVSQQTKNELDHQKNKIPSSDQTSNTQLLQKEINELKKELNEIKSKAENYRQINDKLEKEFREKESKFKEETAKKVEIAVKGVRKEVHIELQQMKEESTNQKIKFNELNEKLEKSEKENKETNEKLKQFNGNLRKEREDFQNKISEFDSQMRAEQRKREKLEKEHELVIKSKDQELFQTRERIVQLEREQRRAQQRLENIEYDSNNRVNVLEKELTKERQEYEDITTRYEQLEKEFLELKSRLVAEKDTLVEAIASIRKSYDEKLSEIKTLKEMLTNRQKEWCKEKFDLQEKTATLESKVSRTSFIEEERNRLKSILIEKENLLESYRKEEKAVKEERDRLRKRCEELMQKITDMEKVERLTRTSNITGKDKELQEYKIRLEHTQTSHKGEVAALHAEYEGRMRLMGEEVNELQRQIAGLANDRDRLRDQLDRDPNLRKGSKMKNDVEDLSAQVLTLRSELESALLENRNLKIQFGTERSGFQIQIAELKTHINQMEERILLETRGSNRNFAKTKMELAWAKERQDNQRLLQETQKFIQELRDKLVNVDKVREKERTEVRKQLQELKSGMDRDTEDSHKRVGELQLDLLDLREAHSKVRSQNERLRRERAAYEKERENLRLTIFAAIELKNKSKDIIKGIEEINKLFVETEKKEPETETGIRRRKTQINGVNIEELKKLVSDVNTKSEDLKNVSLPFKDEDRLRHMVAFRGPPSEASSSQSLSRTPLPHPSSVIRAPPRPKALAKKSVSLDYQIGSSGNRGASEERIWETDDSANTTPTSSISNLRSGPYRGFTSYSGYDSDASYSRYTREGSFGADSETSLPAVPHQKRSLFRFVKKTNSIEDSSTGGSIASAGLTSLALHGFEASPIELAKQRQKKEHSLKYKISKTLSKTFSRSSQSLQNDPKMAQKSEKRPTSPFRALSPTRKYERQVPSPVPSSQEGQKTGAKPGRSRAEASVSTQPLVSKLAIPPSTRTATMPRVRAETNV